MKHLEELYRELSTREFAIASVLSAFVSDNGLLKHNSKPIVGTELCEYLGDNYETFGRALTSLKRKGVIACIRIKSDYSYCTDYKLWCANPHLYNIDCAKSEIVEHFKDSKWK